MALHYRDKSHGNPSTLTIVGIVYVLRSISGGDRIKSLQQRESFLIYTLKETHFPGLNGELYFLLYVVDLIFFIYLVLYDIILSFMHLFQFF